MLRELVRRERDQGPKLGALCRKARILRAASSGDYGDALAARLAAAGARAAQARRAGRPAVTPERLREMMRIVQDQRRAAAGPPAGRAPHRHAAPRHAAPRHAAPRYATPRAWMMRSSLKETEKRLCV